MKRFMSIKAKVTLWYAVIAVILSCLMLWMLRLVTAQTTASYYDDILLQAMGSACDEVFYQDGVPMMGEAADFDLVTYALMDEKGNLWSGSWAPFTAAARDGEVRTAEADGSQWLFQDLLLPFEEGNLWLRGYLALDMMHFAGQQAAVNFAFLLPALLALALLTGYLITHRAFAPVDSMTRQAEQIAEGKDLKQRFDEGKQRDEIGRLAHTFNGMFERLDSSFERERRFTDDASHELRTPITVISAACGFALSSGDDKDKTEALETIRHQSDKMGDMVSQLLSLARMEGGRSVRGTEQVDLSALCVSVCREKSAHTQKRVDSSAVEKGVVIQGDELMLMRLAVNLIDNAVRYAKTTVTVSLHRTQTEAILQVRDDGCALAAEDRERIFDRFFQKDAARSSGAGLGLSIAREIAHLHGGRLYVTPDAQTCLTAELSIHPNQREKG